MIDNKRAVAGVAAVVLTIAGLAACASDDGVGTTSGASTAKTAASTTTMALAPPKDRRVHQHVYRKGETFEYVYTNVESTFATVPAQNGTVPRVTDLQNIDDVRTTVRFTIVSQGGHLRKKVELLHPEFRHVTAKQIASTAGAGPYRPLSEKIPGLPSTLSHTYDLGQDAQVALNLNKAFPDHFDYLLYKFIDIFSFPTSVEPIAADMEPGGVAVSKAHDVSLGGVAFHNHKAVLLYDRIDEIDGLAQAYFKQQNPGNYLGALGMDSNYQETFHVPLTGPTAGLISNGELQEIIFSGGNDAHATVRQVTMTMQTDTTRTAIDAD